MTDTRKTDAEPRCVTLPREVVGQLLAAAQGIYGYLLGHPEARAWRHLWTLAEAISETERALLENGMRPDEQ